MKPYGLELTFKSGATVFVEAVDWELTRLVGGGLSLTWDTPAGAGRRLVRCNLDEVVCIVEVRK